MLAIPAVFIESTQAYIGPATNYNMGVAYTCKSTHSTVQVCQGADNNKGQYYEDEEDQGEGDVDGAAYCDARAQTALVWRSFYHRHLDTGNSVRPEALVSPPSAVQYRYTTATALELTRSNAHAHTASGCARDNCMTDRAIQDRSRGEISWLLCVPSRVFLLSNSSLKGVKSKYSVFCITVNAI